MACSGGGGVDTAARIWSLEHRLANSETGLRFGRFFIFSAQPYEKEVFHKMKRLMFAAICLILLIGLVPTQVAGQVMQNNVITSPENSTTAYPTVVTDDGGGFWNWWNVTGIENPGGAVASAASNSSTFMQANYIKASNFGFNIPNSATINGIEVNVSRHASQNQVYPLREVKDAHLHLIKAGNEVGNDLADTSTIWDSSQYITVSYGSSTNLWGTTWTPSDINDSNFGLRIAPQIADASGGTTSADYDWVNITIYYTLPGRQAVINEAWHAMNESATPNIGTPLGKKWKGDLAGKWNYLNYLSNRPSFSTVYGWYVNLPNYNYAGWSPMDPAKCGSLNGYGRGGQCKFFVNLVLFQSGADQSELPTWTNMSQYFSGSIANVKAGDVIFTTKKGDHIAIVVSVNTKHGKVTSIGVIDSNYVTGDNFWDDNTQSYYPTDTGEVIGYHEIKGGELAKYNVYTGVAYYSN